MSRTFGRVLIGLAILSLIRFAFIVHAGWDYADGDFLHSLPGPHVERVNPTLWRSPDLADGRGFTDFIYGPTQHLTLLPLTAVVSSYRVLARILLVVYAALMLAIVCVMSSTFGAPSTSSKALWPLVTVCVFLFPAATQAFLQREFEIVIAFVWVVAVWAFVSGRETLAGSLFAYGTWFKGYPVVTFIYLLARRRFKAVGAYLAVSAALLGIAHLLFGLERFRTMVGWGTYYLQPVAGARTGVCGQWNPASQTQANLQWGLCGLANRWPWFPAEWLFYVIIALAAGLAFLAFVRFERAGRLNPSADRWRSIWELGLLAVAMTSLIHNQYYYVILVTFPVAALASRYWIDEALSGVKGWLLGAAFVLEGTFIVAPTTPLVRLLGVSGWDVFAVYAPYLYGGLLLVSLLLWEYLALSNVSSAVRPL